MEIDLDLKVQYIIRIKCGLMYEDYNICFKHAVQFAHKNYDICTETIDKDDFKCDVCEGNFSVDIPSIKSKKSHIGHHDNMEKCFEVNAPGYIVNMLQEVEKVIGMINRREVEVFSDEDVELLNEGKKQAEAMITWFKMLNRDGCKPTITWTEFVNLPNVKEKIKKEVMDSFKK